jgi:hypothetical protein
MNDLRSKNTMLIGGALVATLCVAATSTTAAPKTAGKGAETKVARGAYLVTANGCSDCHTPMKMGANGPEPDLSRLLSGHPEQLVMPPPPALPKGPWMVVSSATTTAWAGPWGVSFVANLTPDKETGLGQWTARTFIDTIRTGRHMGKGRPLQPPMPYQAFANYTDDDLEAIFAYLQSIPAIKNRVPGPIAPGGALSASAAKP